MCTGAVSPSSARKAGQDAMADASEVQEAGIARFSEGLLVGSGEEQPAMDNCAMVSTTTPGTASLRRLLISGRPTKPRDGNAGNAGLSDDRLA